MRTSLLRCSACFFTIMVIFALSVSAAPFGKKGTSSKDSKGFPRSKTAKSAGQGVNAVSPFAVETGIDFSILYADGLSDAEKLDRAVQRGDCSWLYAYTRRSDADKLLVTKAKAAIAAYNSDGDVASFRTGRMAEQVRKVPADIQEKVFEKPAGYLPSVVSSLIGTDGSSLGTVKILHDWICDNIAYDTDMLFSGKISGQDWQSVLKKKKAVCSGYANLMNEMCRLAGIESVGISGWSKGFGYKGYLDEYTDHAWNAVNIGNRWYLVDCTLDAGIVESQTFVKLYSTAYLFTSPRVFLYSHLPEREDSQYYAPVLTKEQFLQEPYIMPEFFDLGFSFKDPMPGYTTVISGPTKFELSLAGSGKGVWAELFSAAGDDIVPQSVWVNRNGSCVSLELDVPDRNDYIARVFASNDAEIKWPYMFGIEEFEEFILPAARRLFIDRKITESERGHFIRSYYKVPEIGCYCLNEDQFDTERNAAVDKIIRLLEMSRGIPIVRFTIMSDGSYKGYGRGMSKYPLAFGSYVVATATRVISPVPGSLKTGEKIRFEIESSDFTDFALADWISGDYAAVLGTLVYMERIPNTNRFRFDYSIQKDTVRICVYGIRSEQHDIKRFWEYNPKALLEFPVSH